MDTAKAARILDFWLGVEYLLPASPPKVSAEDRCWTVREEGELPWVDGAKRPWLRETPKLSWRFVAYSHLLDMAGVVEELRRLLGTDPPEEEFRPGDPAAVLSLPLDNRGMLVGDASVASLPWAMGYLKAKRGALEFGGFDGRDGFEERTKGLLREFLVGRCVISPVLAEALQLDPEVVCRRPVTFEDIEAATRLVFAEAGWGVDAAVAEPLRVAAYQTGRTEEPAQDTDILNSFVASDIARVRDAVRTGDYGRGLVSYLFAAPGVPRPGAAQARLDVASPGGAARVLASTMPADLPAGRWPSKHPLVLAQQFAVNRIASDLRGATGLFSVNGPPGTGKTTLLRDVVADLVVERARAMASHERPGAAFSGRIDVRDSKYPAHALADDLCGFGMVVASSNNGAVENVTRELPAAKSVDAPGPAPDYFQEVAESVLAPAKAEARTPGSAWGLIAAVLGSRDRRGVFVQRFWFEREPAGRPPTPDDFCSLPMAVARQAGSAMPWPEARKRFLAALRRTEREAARVQALAETALRSEERRARAIRAAATLETGEADVASRTRSVGDALVASMQARASAAEVEARLEFRRLVQTAEDATSEAGVAWEAADAAALGRTLGRLRDGIAEAEGEEAAARRRSEILAASRPGWLARLFRPSSLRRWAEDSLAASDALLERGKAVSRRRAAAAAVERSLDALAHREKARAGGPFPGPSEVLGATLRETEAAASQARAALALAEGAGRSQIALLTEAERRRDAARTALDDAVREEKDALDTFEQAGIGPAKRAAWRLADRPDDERQKAVPWHDEELSHRRHELFAAALDLHKAFVFANWNRVRANLAHFADLLQGKLPPAALPGGGVRHLWETFFLVVPVVSTTFASFSRLFAGMGRESLGWLLIDEAGQATPEAAVGAVWRAKRTVVVGDPLQIEPVVSLPASAIEAVRERCGIERDWHPTLASAQVLADRANPYGTSIDGQWVGSPLRVHRRCLDPMFTVANRIAYNGLMVYGTSLGEGEAGKTWLGGSCWIDVRAEATDRHWVPAQGDVAVEIVRRVLAAEGRLVTEDGKHNVFVITPFRKVAGEVGKRLRRLGREHPGNDFGRVSGTVHTFQGREADVVVFLLGGDPKSPGAISGYAAAKPNLLNVAVTRAKRRLYVVGDRAQWARHAYYSELASALPRTDAESFLGRREGALAGIGNGHVRRHGP